MMLSINRQPARTGNFLLCGILMLFVVVIASSGCVRRRLTVRSNPPGAVVYVDNQRIGTTPCSVDYVYYGTREVRLALQGYETLTVNQPLPAPWHQTPGIDFVSDNLIPYRIEDDRTISFNLQPQRMAPAEEIIARGEDLRRQSTPVGFAPIAPATAIEPGAPILGPPPQSGVGLPPTQTAAQPFQGFSPQSRSLTPAPALSPAPAASVPSPIRY